MPKTLLPRGAGSALLIGGILLSVALSPMMMPLLREQLHVNCSWGMLGEAAGSWMCADGIGYIVPGLGMLLGPALTLFVAAVLAPFEIAWTPALLRTLALVPPLWAGVATAATALRVDELPSGQTWFGVWGAHAGSSVALALLGTLVIAISSVRGGMLAKAGIALGSIFLLTAVALQPGLLFAVAASVALLAVAPLVSGPREEGAAP